MKKYIFLIVAILSFPFNAQAAPSGTLWSWGGNTYNQLGLGDTIQRTTPTQVGAATYSAVSAGIVHALAIRSDGTLWSWGNNYGGKLCKGDTVNRAAPSQVGTATYAAISASLQSFAIKTDGTLWGCGGNFYADLGLGDTVQRNSLTQIGTATYNVVSTDPFNTIAIRANGTAWEWGANGLWGPGGVLVSRTVPVQVGTATYVTGAAGVGNGVGHFAIRSDGTLWAWGYNSNNQLGLSDPGQQIYIPGYWVNDWEYVDGYWRYPDQLSPVQVGTATYKAVSVGGGFTLAIKSDDTLWAWGDNYYGQLGLGDTIQRTTPTQVGTATYSAISAGSTHSLAIKSDGTLWAWGDNANGQLGLGDIVQRTTPTQVTPGSTYISIAAGQGGIGEYYSLAIKGDAPIGTVSASSNIPASWTIYTPTGGTILGSGVLQNLTSQPTGLYTVVWNPVAGYITPAPQSFTLTSGGTISFSGNYIIVPTVITPTATAVTTSGATLGANVTSLGIPTTITARGTCWGTTPAPTTNCAPATGLTTGVFTHVRAGMTSGTTYYYRGYATNSTGTGYSADGTFTTACGNGTNNPTACNQCSSGQAYYSGSCMSCIGGCTGAGGSISNPNGSLVCDNGALLPPLCVNTCSNGAVNYSTCTINAAGQCLNGNIDPPTCTTPPSFCDNDTTCDPGETILNCPRDCKVRYREF